MAIDCLFHASATTFLYYISQISQVIHLSIEHY